MEEGNILDPSWIELAGPFEEQVRSLFSHVRLTRDQVEDLRGLFNDVESSLRMQWPGCEVVPFGSIITGMGIKTSDVDIYIHIPEWDKTPGDTVTTARNILKKRAYIFAKLIAITSAKVPIVKFYHVPTRRNCDLSFKSPSGVRNSRLISYLLHLDRRAQDLAILVKYWSKVHNLTGTNLMPNYALTLLVIFYLQHVKILPPVHHLQDDTIQIVDNWNTGFTEYAHPPSNKWCLYTILGEFFKYYATFKFNENIISPYLGYPIIRESFKKVTDVPAEFQLYKDNLQKKLCMPLKLDTMMCVQDPFEHSRNCTVAVFPKLGIKVWNYFKFTATLYGRGHQEIFLRGILTKQPHLQQMPEVNQHQVKVKKPNKFKIKKQNKKLYRQNQELKKLKKNVQGSLHVMYEHINNRDKGKRF